MNTAVLKHGGKKSSDTTSKASQNGKLNTLLKPIKLLTKSERKSLREDLGDSVKKMLKM